MPDILQTADGFECSTCGHEWAAVPPDGGAATLVVKDANGNLLESGDSVTLIKDLKLKGGGGTLKVGTKVKNIRLVEGDHNIDCKIDGQAMMLKSEFVKKA